MFERKLGLRRLRDKPDAVRAWSDRTIELNKSESVGFDAEDISCEGRELGHHHIVGSCALIF